jgi:hypothetical protein
MAANDVPTGRGKENICKFREPYTAEVEEVFNKNVTKAFQVPCSDLQGSLGTRNKRDMCEVFRYGSRYLIFQHFDLSLLINCI